MAAITPITTTGSEPTRPISADAADFTWTAAAGGADTILFAGKRILLLVRNDDAGAQTITITSQTRQGRLDPITTYSVGASEYARFGPFSHDGWANASGQLEITTSSANLNIAAVEV